MAYNLLKGKRGIIFGALNEQSIAWKVAERAVEDRDGDNRHNRPVHIDADHMSSPVIFNNSYTPNGTLSLPAGTYDVFFNDATGWIMFEKKQ